MHELRGLFIQIQSNRKSIDAGLKIKNSLIPKKLDIKDEDLLLMISVASVASCFAIKVITKIMTLF